MLKHAEEVIAEDEEARIIDIVRQNLNTVPEETIPSPRVQHGKSHGCVQAKFRVLDSIPARFRKGVFKPGAVYQALIRFSNGEQRDDREKDAHGMAIKLLDVPGSKLQPGEANGTTHDFILVDNPVFFAEDLEEYALFNKHYTEFLDLKNDPRTLLNMFKAEAAKLRLLGDLGLVARARRFPSQTPSSPLGTNYWSTTPYLLGEGLAVKYAAMSFRASAADAQAGVGQSDGLTEALKEELGLGPATFSFGVHEQVDPDLQPVEDTTVPWWPEDDKGGIRSMIALATIEISGLAADSEGLAQNLVFSPWNVLAEHRPLGIINRIRKAVYVELAAERHRLNNPPGFDRLGSTGCPR